MRRTAQTFSTPSSRIVRGQGMTEYIIIVALIAIASVAAVGVFGDSIQASFVKLSAELTGAPAVDAAAVVQTELNNAKTAAGAATTLRNYDN